MAELNSPTSAIYTLDNLSVLRGLNSECVDLIYLDPPFNTGKQWYAPIGGGGGEVGFSDIWGWDRTTGETLQETIERQWEEERDYAGTAVREVVEAAVAAHSPQMGSYLAWMAPRLIEMHRTLKSTGSIYLHCDPFANSYLRLMLDAIFGSGMMRNELVWERTAGRSDAKKFAAVHDSLLVYSKTGNPTWNRVYQPLDPGYVERMYRHSDHRGRYTTAPLRGKGISGRTYTYEWRGIRSEHWRFPMESLEALAADDRIHWGKGPRRKSYLSDSKGVAARDVITGIGRPSGRERVGYPTQKPIALLSRIIEASSNLDDVVLDPFAGCASACIAAHKIGRRWIGIDIEPKAVELCRMRLINELGYEGRIDNRTSPPIRSEPRQLELIPHNRRLRLELWERLQRETGLDVPACTGCKRAPGVDYMEVDHIIPRSRGGEHVWSNVQLLCGPCNRSKGNKTMAQWQRERAATVSRGNSSV